jgi:hypothetical protein
LTRRCRLSVPLYLAFAPSGNTKIALSLSIATSIGLSLTYNHVSAFWKDKSQVPLVKDYNEAISISNDMRMYLIALAVSWWLAASYYLPKAINVV